MSRFHTIGIYAAVFAAVLLLCHEVQAAPSQGQSQSPSQSQPDVRAQVEALLREHPEIVLDVLRGHSEEVLDIAQQGAEKRRRQTLLSQWENDRKNPKSVALEGRPVGGPADAPVTVIAFSDFLCTYCHQAAFTLGTLMKRYQGKIRLIFKQVPKDEPGRVAGCWFLAAYEQDKVKAWKMYALLFDRQHDLETDLEGTLKAVAAEVGLDAARIASDLKAHAREHAAIMDGDAADAKSLGFVGTPYFLVNDRIIRGALPLENFIDAVELALKDAPAK